MFTFGLFEVDRPERGGRWEACACWFVMIDVENGSANWEPSRTKCAGGVKSRKPCGASKD